MKGTTRQIKAEEEQQSIYGMPSLFPEMQVKPIVVEHTVKSEDFYGKKEERRGRKRNYTEIKDMMEHCRSITYVLRKDGVEVLSMCCKTHRTAWEASRLTSDLLKRRIANECTVKYEH